jgi:hypothetical protein
MELLEYLRNDQLLMKDFVGTDSVRQVVSGLVMIRTAVLVLVHGKWDIAPRHVHLTSETSGTSAISQKNEESPQVRINV